jgi:quercetin dioxygenase-like cupin family protein
MKILHLLLPGLLCALLVGQVCSAAESSAPGSSSAPPLYSYATNGVKDNINFVGAKWKLLLDESNLGGKELEAVELTLPAGTTTPSHTHRSIEVLYVLSGTYDHEVNGKRYRLTPGMIGIVRPGDKVRHIVPKAGDAKLLIIWVPAGEAERGIAQAKGSPLEPVPELQKAAPP